MHRAERLFQLTTLLRNRRTVLTARQLSEHLQVSERTIYRDIQSLSLSGVPIEGEAGVGYRLSHRYQLPPLMFDREEVEALLLGARMVSGWGDMDMARHANQAIQKILAVLPDHLRHSDETLPLLVPNMEEVQRYYTAHSQTIRAAIRIHQRLRIDYIRADEERSSRVIEPLGLIFWGKVWTLVAWCQLREDYRTFRLDRIQSLDMTGETFATHEQKSLKHFLHIMKARHEQDCDKAPSNPQEPL
ncbi:helix-turn-helix transcriptional regulator [Cellvibrio japonicus]|uniref:Predicted transcriptional regulator n=1 Tax=Cellvibrio japonicus (strain Ueda107) TaxID=498211 RepID=B3PHR5_CELJU|nr:YafY family protein [Cellvibrio japonicus]ACE83550.1 predicted transcriptional regulator [Cellvibrio japonicus Ueda107]QEI13861.1 YafY family transcriptional regulator [Cellvibrio japonicus]QEI17435.1 YafY family transcriptional regulator [Cellvibrio japonicus]QEI21011.1 YafY family transcriptional regulator [Cellvibrio japonicus]